MHRFGISCMLMLPASGTWRDLNTITFVVLFPRPRQCKRYYGDTMHDHDQALRSRRVRPVQCYVCVLCSCYSYTTRCADYYDGLFIDRQPAQQDAMQLGSCPSIPSPSIPILLT